MPNKMIAPAKRKSDKKKLVEPFGNSSTSFFNITIGDADTMDSKVIRIQLIINSHRKETVCG
jgi:hypothetical protein